MYRGGSATHARPTSPCTNFWGRPPEFLQRQWTLRLNAGKVYPNPSVTRVPAKVIRHVAFANLWLSPIRISLFRGSWQSQAWLAWLRSSPRAQSGRHLAPIGERVASNAIRHNLTGRRHLRRTPAHLLPPRLPCTANLTVETPGKPRGFASSVPMRQLDRDDASSTWQHGDMATSSS